MKKIWDFCILTATNEPQAEVYRLQFDRLKRAGILHSETAHFVVSDPDGKRIGSGGATLNALRQISDQIDGKKILIVHSGGDSRRIPQHSLFGKVFAPLPDPMCSVFESIYRFACEIGDQIDEGIVVTCGDTAINFPNFNKSINILQQFDLISVGFRGSLELGQNHGVFDSDPETFSLKQFLQKHPIDQLRKYADQNEKVAIDTGILVFQRRSISALKRLISEISEDDYLDLYGEMLPSFSRSAEIDFGVWLPKNLEFYHTGTTRQYLDLIGQFPKIINFWIPIRSENDQIKWIEISYDADDLPTEVGDQSTLFGKSIFEWLGKNQIPADLIWQGVSADERSLWNAHIFPISDAPDYNERTGAPSWFTDPDQAWLDGERFSIASAMRSADRVLAFDGYQNRRALRLTAEMINKIESNDDRDLHPTINEILTETGFRTAMTLFEMTCDLIDEPLVLARLHKLISDFAKKLSHDEIAEKHEKLAFASVREAVKNSITFGATAETTKITLPVRIDLAGGWTDTPPYSLERGGAVLNIAIQLRGEDPISVTTRWLSERVVRFRSVDQDKSIEISDFSELRAMPDLRSPLALPHAVILSCGILDHLENGIEIITECNVPMGSGLGTSSILAAGLVMSVWQLIGVRWTDEQLFNQVLYVEQMLGSGGGWQDQIGGVVPSFKLTTTEPGIPQRFRVDRFKLDEEIIREIEDLLVVIYTGQQRVAKNILELVVADWLSRRPDLVETLTQIRNDAYEMRSALRNGDLKRFGFLLRRYFECKKVLNAGTTNDEIDAMISAVSDLCDGWGVAGAGGGGFMAFLAKDRESRSEIEARLSAFPNVEIYEWNIARVDDLTQNLED